MKGVGSLCLARQIISSATQINQAAYAYNPVGNRTTGGSVVNAGNQLTADAT